ncbi:glycosyltransferase family 2 protein [Flavobacteriaceae bacterium XHP0103]|uniref:glycosyltransferase family 2 protein n=1 Tax=Marixanthotalea marina TaxID=2844359 RepID=UPI002989EA25|nr:glycosyltransferase family 2 protein [Marixanthotalea marina]MBU3822739.1 glycosyltransferase family 2 protein [Marixanthotalea marina]
MNPKVSIIMATYNRASYILESIQSIQNQTFRDFECLIIDDGGTDNTKDVLLPVLAKDHRFKYYVRTPEYQKGLPGTRNYGLDLAAGDYIIFFDDDDIAHPQNLELCVKELVANPNMSFCRYIRNVFRGDFNYTFNYSTDYTSFFIDASDINKILKNDIHFNSCAVMWKRKCFEKHRFVEHLMYAEEWELYPRIISNGHRGMSINKTLFFGRKHMHSNTGEFHSKNKIREASFVDAIILVLKNLKEKDLLSDEITHYFIQVALRYKSYGLFNRIMDVLEFSFLDEWKWRFFNFCLPLRLFLYKKYKNLTK